MLYEYIEERAYGIHLCFVLQKKGKKDRGHLYFSIVFHQSTSFSSQKKSDELHRKPVHS